MVIIMDNFCGSPFWLHNLTWNITTQPDLTPCFQETFLIWLPCLILWLFAPLNFISVYKSNRRYIPITLLNLFKTFLAAVLSVLSFVEVIEVLATKQEPGGSGVPLVEYVTPTVKTLTYILLFFLYIFHRRKGVHTSGLVLVFWIFMSFAVVINFRSILRSTFQDHATTTLADWNNISELKFTLRIVSAPIVIIQLVLACIADKRAEDVSMLIGENQRNRNPEREASILSQLTFWWLNPIMLLGYKRPLSQEDLYSVRHQDKTEFVTQRFDEFLEPAIQKALDEKRSMNETFSPRFEPAYKSTLLGERQTGVESSSWFSSYNRLSRQSENGKKRKEAVPEEEEIAKHVGLANIIFKTFWQNILFAAILKLIGSVLTFASPIMLSRIITFVSSDEPSWRGIIYAGLLFFISFINSLITTNEFYINQVNVLRVRTCTTAAVYRKTLKLSNQGRKNYTTGQIVNFMAVDTQKVAEFVDSMNNLWSAPISLTLSMVLLYQQLGIAIFGGLLIMLINIPFNGWIAVKVRELQKTMMKIKDKRIKLVSEILNGIKIIKIHAWEEPFRKRTEKIRKEEIGVLEKQAWYSAGITFAFTTLPFVVALASFALYLGLDSSNVLDANKIFVSLSLFNIMRIPLAILPMLIANVTSFLVSVRRLNRFLESDEIDLNAIEQIDDDKSVIKIKNANFKWETKGDVVLDNINLEIPRMKLVAIVGPVGSGKSTLVSAILGDLEKCDGKLMVDQNSSIAYVPQEAWILNTSFKNNIMFNKVVNMDKYRKVIDACALGPDLKTLNLGDESEIGEKGLNLSGGQKQRISLARAVYADKDIYLFDDPLNAVDAHVGRHIFDKVIGPKGILRDRTRVLVTNKLSVLPDVDHILVMKDGKISESGTYESLLRENGLFSKLLVDYVIENNQGVEISDSARGELITKELKRLEQKQLEESQNEELMQQETQRRKSSIMKPQLPPIKEQESQGGNLTGKEVSQVGSVGLNVHLNFIKTMGMSFMVGLMVFIASGAFTLSSSIWLSDWSNDSLNETLKNDTLLRDYRLTIYAVLGFAEAGLVILSTILINLGILNSSRKLHNSMLARVIKAPMSWFDTTPSGRIMNRFSKDIETVDTTIRFNVRMLLNTGLRSITALILISIGSVYSIILIVPIVLLYFLFQIFYISTSRQLKRIESTTKSPVYSHFSETIVGTTSIRAFKASKEFTLESNHRVDVNNASAYISIVASRWLAIRLETLGFIVVLSASLIAVLSRGTISPGIAGLTVSYSLTITQVLSFLVRTYSDYETNVVCLERVVEFTKLPVEPEDEEEPFDEAWPARGEIVFDNFSTRYRPELELVLKDFNLKVNPAEKLGLCGRTGAGKSSITLSLFRIIEATEGCIVIDDVNISHINLGVLRSKLSIIPQEPILFTGTIRQNVDPTDTYTDEEIWKAIDLAHLGTFLRGLESGLEHEVNEGGSNFSVGQKQLFCLARTLLRRSKILILDEATAAVDVETDNLIQQTIRKEFKDSTILTIAHRLETIQDYDRVAVMENGTLAEVGAPMALMKNSKTQFHSLAKEAGLTK